MGIINVQAAIPQSIRDAARDKIAKGEMPAAQMDKIKARISDVGHRTYADKGVTYHYYDFQAESEADIDSMLAAYPGAVIIGAWDYETGIQYGMWRDDVGELQGTPKYPFKRMMHVGMRPAKKTRDPMTGNVTLETPQTEPGDDHLWMGQAARIYDV